MAFLVDKESLGARDFLQDVFSKQVQDHSLIRQRLIIRIKWLSKSIKSPLEPETFFSMASASRSKTTA
jgi:hypothetical protein